MRDAKEIWHFPDPANDVVVISSRLVRRNTLRRLARYAASVPNFLCNAAQSFGKEWETVCVSGFTGTKATKPKTRKGNQIMKNRNIQFKPTAGVLIPLLLACFAAVFISAPNSGSQPATWCRSTALSRGTVDSQSGTECEPSIHVINFGHANQLGAFTGTAEFFSAPLRARPGSL